MTDTFDPTFKIQPRTPAPVTTGQVLQLVDSDAGSYLVSINGHTYTCLSAGKNVLDVGDSVSVMWAQPSPFVVKADAGYESRWRKNLWELSKKYPANAWMLYLLKDNPKSYLYSQARYIADTSTDNVATVERWDGKLMDVPVAYGTAPATLGGHNTGDPVLLRQLYPGYWEAVGALESYQFWLLAFDYSSPNYHAQAGSGIDSSAVEYSLDYDLDAGTYDLSSDGRWEGGNFRIFDYPYNQATPTFYFDLEGANPRISRGSTMSGAGTYAVDFIPAAPIYSNCIVWAYFRALSTQHTSISVSVDLNITYTDSTGTSKQETKSWGTTAAGSISESDLAYEYDVDGVYHRTIITNSNQKIAYSPIEFNLASKDGAGIARVTGTVTVEGS